MYKQYQMGVTVIIHIHAEYVVLIQNADVSGEYCFTKKYQPENSLFSL